MAPLEDGAAETLRSAVMRLGFLALDRPDMQPCCEGSIRAFFADVFATLSMPPL